MRKIERYLVNIVGVWQILDGLITIAIYGLYRRSQFAGIENLSFNQAKGLESIFGSVYMFINLFGVMLLAMGILNLVIARNYMKDNTIDKRVGAWLVFNGIFSYFIMDLVSVVLLLTGSLVYMAKNKAISMLDKVDT